MTELVPLALSLAQAVKMAGLGKTSLYQAIADGRLMCRKAGRRTLVETAELKRFIQSLPSNRDTKDAA